MKALARCHVWWPGIDNDIELLVKKCQACQAHRNVDPPAPPASWPQPTAPWTRIHADFAGPVAGKMYLVITDAFSKWLEVVQMTSTTSRTTIVELTRLFAQFGLPHALVTDNGTQFTSAEFATFMNERGIRHLRSAPYHPATNGAAERNVQTLKSALKEEKSNGLATAEVLQQFLQRYRSTPHSTTGETPAALFLKREMRTKLDVLKPVKKSAQPQQQSEETKTFVEGDHVQARMYQHSKKWMPGVITQSVGTRSYLVRLASGLVVRRHVNQLRSCPPADELLEQPKSIAEQTPSPRRSVRIRYRPARLAE